MNDFLNFRISSGLKNILGRDLITNDNIAVLELVKNSYDAHASKVEITFEEDRLTIADNGKGMSMNDLLDKWLFVGYSAKRDGTEDTSYRAKMKRHYAGAKGIGRMSCDRLAKKLTLVTKSADFSTTERLSIDWDTFEQDQKEEFGEITFPHESTKDMPYFPENKETGTILRFTNLRREWTFERISSLRKALEKMINPFAETSAFQIEIIAPHFVEKDNAIRSKMNEIEHSAKNENEKLTALAEEEQKIVNGPIVNRMASILSLKTTQIESKLLDGVITTTLSDRGTLMYKIEEDSIYPHLEDVSINLYYLNRKAKYNFALKMGVEVVNYGNVFLFRNGFRIYPYGEPADDSWGLNKRVQQGYNRTIGTRDLVGRVDVETERVDDFKEVSSRDGGLVETEASRELFAYVTKVHRLLERYVVGVLWGINFLNSDYFKDENTAIVERQKLQEEEKKSESTEHVYDSIGSRVDFVQLIKSLTNNPSMRVIDYNKDLVNIVSKPTELDKLQTKILDDLRKVADRTHDSALLQRINAFEKELEKLRKKKNEAERRVLEEKTKREQAEYRALEAENRRKEEVEKRKTKEKELAAQKQVNMYLSATQHTSPEVLDLMHAVALSSNDLNALIDSVSVGLRDKSLSIGDVLNYLDEMSFHTSRIIKISKMLTKADIVLLSRATEIDLKEYIKEYVFNFEHSIHVVYGHEYEGIKKKLIPVLELSIVLDNLISNAKKADATEITLDFEERNGTIEIAFSDNGKGVNLERYTPESIFDPGVTDRRGGSGIGLSTIRKFMDKDLNGEIAFAGNGLRYSTGATFVLKFY